MDLRSKRSEGWALFERGARDALLYFDLFETEIANQFRQNDLLVMQGNQKLTKEELEHLKSTQTLTIMSYCLQTNKS